MARLVNVSKFLSKHLRHAPEAAGRWVPVDELLAASERIG
jgi:RNA:NAD 2'-phosphotransferase (TPT1/KptA family)